LEKCYYKINVTETLLTVVRGLLRGVCHCALHLDAACARKVTNGVNKREEQNERSATNRSQHDSSLLLPAASEPLAATEQSTHGPLIVAPSWQDSTPLFTLHSAPLCSDRYYCLCPPDEPSMSNSPSPTNSEARCKPVIGQCGQATRVSSGTRHCRTVAVPLVHRYESSLVETCPALA